MQFKKIYGVFANQNYKKGMYVCFYDEQFKNIQSIDDFRYSIIEPFNNKRFIGYNYVKNKNGVG